VHEDSIMQCTVSCGIIEEQSNGKFNLIKVWYIHVWNNRVTPPELTKYN
jgi:hypothetical protein